MAKPGFILGVDLGGTKTALGLYESDSLLRIKEQILPTGAEKGFEEVKRNLIGEIESFMEPGTAALGLGVPGLIDATTKKILVMPNIPGSSGSDLRRDLSEHFGLPVTIENDARCFALAEALLGAGKGHSVVVGITLGTGVGGGIVIDGELYRGAHGFAAELGHMLLVPGSPPFETPDRRGEVEQFLSGTALGKRCPAAKSPRDYLEGDMCRDLRPRLIKEICWLVSSLVHSLDPSIVVFGGSVGRALKPHLLELHEELKNWLLKGYKRPEIACCILEDSARRGACLLAKRSMV